MWGCEASWATVSTSTHKCKAPQITFTLWSRLTVLTAFHEQMWLRADPSKVLKEHEEMQGISWGWEEIKSLVEGSGGLILGVDNQGADAGNVGSLQCPEHRVFEQSRTNPSCVPAEIHR